MSASTRSILVGGWKAFAEDNGVNTKEPVENFDWMPSESDKGYYLDCRDALDRVEGSREWLKAYTCAKDDYPFSCSMADKVTPHMSKGHSGASMTCLLWSYKRLLNDWDNWVFLTKNEHYQRLYKNRQISSSICHALLTMCEDPKQEEQMRLQCAQNGLARDTVAEIREILQQIHKDHTVIQAEEDKKDAERYHRDLIESLEFLYEHPMRWFDTRHGCSLSPGSPKNITRAAMDEMESKHPGYSGHIDALNEAIFVFNSTHRNEAFSNFSEAGKKVLDQFMRDREISADIVKRNEEKVRRIHGDLIECLEFLYTRPSRWFDSEYGSSLSPYTPSMITSVAMREMESKHPGYRQHIAAVICGIPMFNREQRTEGFCNMSQPGMAVVDEFMRANGIVVA